MSLTTAGKNRLAVFAVAVAATLSAAGSARAETVDLDAAPPDLLTSVRPNVALTFDDSGSMSRAYMPDEIGDKNRYNDSATGAGSRFVANYYYYGANTIYYNPAIAYKPPLRPDGTTSFPNASYIAAWRDGICANVPADGSQGAACVPNIVNLSTAFYLKFDSFRGNDDAASASNALSTRDIPAGVRTLGGTALVGGFYYEREPNGTLRLVSVNGASNDQKVNFANWYSYYRTRSLMARSALGTAFAKRDDAIRIAYQNLTSNPFADASTIEVFTGAARAAFFKWLMTDRGPGGGGTLNRSAMRRAITFFSSGYSQGKGTGANGKFNPYWETVTGRQGGGLELTCRQNYHLLVTDGYWNYDAPADAGPKVSQSFLLPDGRQYSSSSANTRVYWNENRANGGDALPSLADIGFQS
ncbi:MAG TPA: hypothetical protein VM555_00060, partial [Tahibacter sp.]|nr:hypothetical protein [Tahibacter sp.]